VGADDYITKPFDVQELRLRVRNALKRVSQGSLTNPVSGLPEGPLVEERLSEVIHKSGWALLHISVSHLESSAKPMVLSHLMMSCVPSAS
jgi:DNA-binding response OmpR family regulator